MSADFEGLRDELARLIGVDADLLTPERNLLECGLDSLRIMTLVERFRERGVEVTFLDLAESPTLSAFARLLHAGGADV